MLAGEELLAEESGSRARRWQGGRGRARDRIAVKDLRAGALAGVSFRVERGEIVGIAGLAGSGRNSTWARLRRSSPRWGPRDGQGGRSRRAGPMSHQPRNAYLALDRKVGGGVMTMSARENLTLPDLKPFWKGGSCADGRNGEDKGVERLSVRPAHAVNEPLGIFSGGNQQKILSQVVATAAVGVPAGRADPGRRCRRQGRSSTRAHRRSRERSRVVVTRVTSRSCRPVRSRPRHRRWSIQRTTCGRRVTEGNITRGSVDVAVPARPPPRRAARRISARWARSSGASTRHRLERLRSASATTARSRSHGSGSPVAHAFNAQLCTNRAVAQADVNGGRKSGRAPGGSWCCASQPARRSRSRRSERDGGEKPRQLSLSVALVRR